MNGVKEKVFFSSIFVLAALLPAAAHALQNPQTQIGSEVQSIEQQAAEGAAQRPRVKAPTISEPEEAKEKPGTGADIKFFIKTIKIQGMAVVPESELRPLIAKYENRQTNFAEILDLTNKITAYYRLKGYVTSRAFVPPQKVLDQTLTIQVVEGKLGKTIVEGNRFFATDWLLQYMTIDPGEVIQFSDLQKDVQLLNRNPDHEVSAVFMPGEAPGTSDILLKVKDRWPVHFAHVFDNTGTRTTGRLHQGAQLRHSSLTGRDDTLFGMVTISEHGDLVAEAVQYLYPVKPAGGRFILSYSHSDIELGKELRFLNVKGGANIFGLTYAHPFIAKDKWSLDWDAGFDFKEVWSTVNGDENSRDHLRVAHFGPNFLLRDGWGYTTVKNDFVFGIPSFLGGNVKVDSRSNREGAGGQFFKDQILVNRAQRFLWDTVLLGKFQTQLTKYLVVSSEQFRAGGYDTVRGYGEGDSLGDYGLLQSTEIRVPPYFIPKDFKLPGHTQPLYQCVQFVGFADMAKTYLRRASLTQESSKLLVGVGGGLRVDFPNQVSFRADWGFPIGDRPEDGAEVRLHFGLTTQLPDMSGMGQWLQPASKS